MDSDLVSLYKRDKNTTTFSKVKDFKVGQMPFDAMIEDGKYIVGFFLSKSFGVIDLDKLEYKEIKIRADKDRPVLKVPHFWILVYLVGRLRNYFIPLARFGRNYLRVNWVLNWIRKF